MIYFIQGQITRKIKIGFTAWQIKNRLNSLQGSSPDTLMFLGAHPGSFIDEKSLHIKFNKHHSHYEWFFENEDLKKYIKNHAFFDIETAQYVDSMYRENIVTLNVALSLSNEEIKNIFLENIQKKLARRSD